MQNSKYYFSFFNRVSIPKYRVNSNVYQFRPPKRAHLSDLSTDSVALANVIIIIIIIGKDLFIMK